MTSPFLVLGLAERADLTDDEVRAAWRRLAAATHPDRADHGDPAAFAAAAVAYALLRTAAGRHEALTDLRIGAVDRAPGDRVPGTALAHATVTLAARISRGRPLRLVVRLLAAAATSYLAVAAAGWQPASAAILAGALTWLLVTSRS